MPEEDEIIAKIKRGEHIQHYETVRIRKDGLRVEISLTVSPVKDSSGQIIGISKIIRDISEKKSFEKQLKDSEKRLYKVIDNLAEGLIICNENGDIVLWNRAYVELYEYSKDEIEKLYSRKLSDLTDSIELCTLDGRKLEFDEWLITRIFRGEKIKNVELIVRRKNTNFEKIFCFSGAKIVDVDGHGIAFLSFTDQTERHKYQFELERLNKSLEEIVDERTQKLNIVNQELEAFSFSVSHDLRTPLRAMDGFSRALIEDYGSILDETGLNYLNRIRKASQHMGHLIDDLLMLSRISRNEFAKTDVNLSEIAGEIAEKLQELKPRENVEFEIQPNMTAFADQRMIAIALENLLGNAYKFTSKREHSKIVFGQVQTENGPEFFISDNGAGFDMNYVNKLFVAFQRLHSTAEFEGTGIGLAIVQRIISRHGGTIRAQAKVDEGASFYFSL